MSPVTRLRRDGSRRPARYHAVQPLVVAWLTLVWVLLWGEPSPLVVVGGVLLAILISVVLPLPPMRLQMRVHPLGLLRLVVRFLCDVVVASLQVVRAALRRDAGSLRSAVIEVPLRTPSDFVLTIVAELVSLIPGSVVVEARRSSHTLFLHVLDVPDAAAANRARAVVLDQEQRVLRALGGTIDPPAPATRPGGEGAS